MTDSDAGCFLCAHAPACLPRGNCAPQVASRLVRRLSSRQREVAQLLACGLSSQQIASKLDIGERTVRDHESLIARRLGPARRVLGVIVYVWHSSQHGPGQHDVVACLFCQHAPVILEPTSRAVAEACARMETVGRRERDAALLIACGKSDHEVAQALFISPRTAEWHAEQLMRALGVHRRAVVGILAYVWHEQACPSATSLLADPVP